MDISLQHRTAIVTGASKGIGAGIATSLAAAGASVVVNYNSDSAGADRVVKEIAEAGGRALAVRADVSRGADVTALFAAARDAFGTVNVLVNNAAVAAFGPIEAITEESYRQHMDINLWGTLLTTQALIGQPGLGDASIINVSTAGTTFHPPYGAIYVASKAAVNAATLVASKELASRGIRVNAMLPGYSDTEGTRSIGFVDSPAAEQALAGVPMGRLGVPDDFGPAAVFLASDAAHWITGAVLHVSGGLR